MKLMTRMTTLAITAVALAGVLGAQQRTNGRGAPRSQPRASGPATVRSQPRMSGQSFARVQQPPRGQMDFRARQDVRGQQYSRAGADMRGGNTYQQRNVYRTPTPYRVPVADHGRPLITRGVAPGRDYVRPNVYGGTRFGGDREFRGGREFREGRWFYGGRAFPFGWESRVIFGGFFPIGYAGYCDAVPYDYDYMLPPMLPSYDPCLFGDRVIVFDRFSRHIVFVATL
jgi:hypothetical protein